MRGVEYSIGVKLEQARNELERDINRILHGNIVKDDPTV